MSFKNDKVFKMMEEFKSVRDMLERFMLATWKDVSNSPETPSLPVPRVSSTTSPDLSCLAEATIPIHTSITV